MNDTPTKPDPDRLPWPYTAAALVAFAALYISGPGFLGLPVMAALLLGTYATSRRLPQNLAVAWGLRAVVFTVVIFAAGERRPSGASVLLDPEYVHLFGYLSGGELVLRAWLRRAGGPSRGESMVLSALVFMTATNTFDTRHIQWLAPVYAVCLALSLRRFGLRAAPPPRGPASHRPAVILRGVALASALLLGLGASAAVHRWEGPLTRWSTSLLMGRGKVVRTPVGVSTAPVLGRTFNPSASAGRVIRLEGLPAAAEEVYLRGMTFDRYGNGAWGPALSRRYFDPVEPDDLHPDVIGSRVRITRLTDEAGLLYVPPAATGLVVGPGEVERERDGRGAAASTTLRTTDDAADGTFRYEAIVPHAPAPAPPPARPAAAALGPYLAVPEHVKAAVSDLARRVTASAESERDKAAAVQHYLQHNHAYSLEFDPGRGEPLVSFLAGRGAAHCQYFASAAVILLRCSGVPARYVNGYYAHERADDGALVVRQRDAHAWAEYWDDGVGWVTLDATPGNGRPDGLFPPVSPWRRGWEHVVDGVAAARARLGRVGWTPVAALAAAVGGGWVAWRLWKRRGARRRRLATQAYASPGAELAALGARFERQLLRRGVAPAPHRTWREQLSTAPSDDLSAAAAAFIEGYDAARFGDVDRTEVARLAEVLDAMERAAPRVKR